MWNVNRAFRTCNVNQFFQWLPTQFFRSLPRHVLLIKLQTFCRTVGCAGTATLVDTREKYLLFATIPEAASEFYRSALGCSEWGLISYAVHAEVIKRRATFGSID